LLESTAQSFILTATHLEEVHLIQPLTIASVSSLVRAMLVKNDRAGVMQRGGFAGDCFAAHSTTGAIQAARELELMEARLAEIEDRLGNFMTSDGVRPSAMGSSAAVDEMIARDQCETDLDDGSIHEQFRCASIAMQSEMLADYLRKGRDLALPLSDGHLEDERVLAGLHLMDFHWLPLMAELEHLIGWDVPETQVKRFQTLGVAMLVVQLACSIVLFAVLNTLRDMAVSTYLGFVAFCRRLPPEAIVSHRPLLLYLLGGKSGADRARTVAAAVINAMKDPVVFTNHARMIEFVSPSVQVVFEETPEQLLGQPLTSMFQGEAGTKLGVQLELMQKGEAPRTYTETLSCNRADGAMLQCTVTFLLLHSQASGDAFVAIFKDKSELIAGQEEAARAKARSEELLYEILPRGIVQRLTQGETDITFVVQSATLMFVDIQKFSDYAATLTPQATMANLSRIFQGYDSHIKAYPLVMKMKLVGDVYMVAAGLFNPEAEASAHAEQMCRFGHDCLAVIEDTNSALDISLAIRVGINSGGPLVAGVLGTDKPLFDILGDTINVAARLQSTDVAGNVQVSESTYKLTQACEGFTFESRGMVQLKGKGPRPAYFVKVAKPVVKSDSIQAGLRGQGSVNASSILSMSRMLGGTSFVLPDAAPF
jgi:class 3 adenylate cyclase